MCKAGGQRHYPAIAIRHGTRRVMQILEARNEKVQQLANAVFRLSQLHNTSAGHIHVWFVKLWGARDRPNWRH